MSAARSAALAALLALAPAFAAAQDAHVLVVSGLGGSPEYSERFAGWAAGLVDAARAAGVPARRVTWLAERDGLHAAAAGVARRPALEAAVRSLAETSSPGDLVLVALFGHGSARGGEATLNLPGPDLSAADLAALLEPLGDRRVVVVNAASASGGWVPALAAPGRVVITATRSAGEAEATRFGGHFVEALAGAGADTDKDGAVSVLEAFEYARTEVARSFAAAGTLPTEHALLEDDGDGRGSLEPGETDGALAARLTLAGRGTGAAAPSDGPADPELARLLAEKARLESELRALRGREASMPAAEYQRELERLLLEVARNGRSIREHGGGDA